jgi:hypothetical protein
MVTHWLIAGVLLQATTPSSAPGPAPSASSGTQVTTKIKSSSKEADSDPAALLKVKRIYVDSFGDDVVSRDLQSTIVSSLVATKRFKVTENRDRADATLKGVALEKTSQELHSYGEGTAVGQAAVSDSSTHTETLNEARVSIRLVDLDGDVIWTTTQESKGAKYKSASADVADKCVKQLLRDVERLENPSSTPSSTATAPAAEANHK